MINRRITTMKKPKNDDLEKLEKLTIEKSESTVSEKEFHKLIKDYRILYNLELDKKKAKTENICKVIETSLKIGFFAFSIVCGVREISGNWLPINFITKAAVSDGVPKMK